MGWVRARKWFGLMSAAVVCTVISGANRYIPWPSGGSIPGTKAAHVDEALVNFVRPGLAIKILGAQADPDGVVKVRARFEDPRGLPLDKDGITTPGALRGGRPGMMIAYLTRDPSPYYVSYITRVATDPATGKTAEQATSENNGTWVKLAEGEYEYTFAKKLPPGYDRSATHAVGIFATRDLTEFGLGIDQADAVFHFTPNGSPVAPPRDIVRTETCRKCHHDMQFDTHTLSGRISMEVCILCHGPKSYDPNGESLDMKVMVHRIHMSRSLPSVVAGGKFGYRGRDYSRIWYAADVRECQVCHEPNSRAAMADHWLRRPSRAACGSCHDNVNFATGENHVSLLQLSDNECANCHIPKGELEFDASILGAHTIPRLSESLEGVVFAILRVLDGSAGKKPTVIFTVKDRKGNPIEPGKLTQLTAVLAGPTSDYTNFWSENARNATVSPNGEYSYTFQNAIPAGATGAYSITLQGGRDVKLLEGTAKERIARERAENKTVYFSVDGSPVQPRRTVVSMAKCRNCHGSFTYHGEARNTVEFCVTCHNPTYTSQRYRHSLDFRTLIHRMHTGKFLQMEFAFGPNRPYNEVVYPGNLANCSACHVNNSERLPLNGKREAVADPSGYINPAPPVTAACLGCHSSRDAAAHALTSMTELGESCDACHGTGKAFAVERVHGH